MRALMGGLLQPGSAKTGTLCGGSSSYCTAHLPRHNTPTPKHIVPQLHNFPINCQQRWPGLHTVQSAAGTTAAAWPAQLQWQHCRTLPYEAPWMSSIQCSTMRTANKPAATAATIAAHPTAAQQQQLEASELQQLRDRLQLHNTMSRKKEHVKPRSDMGDRLQMYVCGVTVYDFSHIGHARVYVAFDVLYRLLRYLQYDVQYVRNFTDIDDKIIKRAAESGEDPLQLSARFIEEFNKDMLDLGCLTPTVEPKATDFIPEMIATISRIIDNGHAYVLPEGDVYFEVDSLPGYGRLSGRSQEDNRAGERVAVDGRKRGPADFALWKAAKPGEPSWGAPWGEGRPGWHIECSSMIASIMGPVIDIHGGGRDLVFPHHENELAQSQAAAGVCGCGETHQHQQGVDGDSSAAGDFVRYWLHNGFVNVDSEKMSKSLGNFFTIREVLQLYHPLAMRWFLVNSQYRAPINYNQKALEEASDRIFYIYQTMADVEAVLEGAGEAGAAAAAAVAAGQAGAGRELLSVLVEGLLDDINTPQCVSGLSGPLKTINDLLTTKAGRKNPQRLQFLAQYQWGLRASLDLLGLIPSDLHVALHQLKQLALTRAGLTQAEVEAHIAVRTAARAAKDFAAADAVRQQLAAKGIMLMDTAQGTAWRPGSPEGTG